MSCKNISAGLFSAREHSLTFRESFNATFYDKAEKIPRMIVNVTVTQHHRRPSAQTGRIKSYCSWFWVALAGFGGACWWFWLVLAGSMF